MVFEKQIQEKSTDNIPAQLNTASIRKIIHIDMDCFYATEFS